MYTLFCTVVICTISVPYRDTVIIRTISEQVSSIRLADHMNGIKGGKRKRRGGKKKRKLSQDDDDGDGDGDDDDDDGAYDSGPDGGTSDNGRRAASPTRGKSIPLKKAKVSLNARQKNVVYMRKKEEEEKKAVEEKEDGAEEKEVAEEEEERHVMTEEDKKKKAAGKMEVVEKGDSDDQKDKEIEELVVHLTAFTMGQSVHLVSASAKIFASGTVFTRKHTHTHTRTHTHALTIPFEVMDPDVKMGFDHPPNSYVKIKSIGFTLEQGHESVTFPRAQKDDGWHVCTADETEIPPPAGKRKSRDVSAAELKACAPFIIYNEYVK
jgi:hypothetical protein